MRAVHISLLFHIIGIGLIFTTMVAGWILDGQYRNASDWKTKGVILKSLRPVGLLSPVAVFVMVASGIGNMTLGYRTYTLFSDSWLTYKLVFFLVAMVSGMFLGARSSRRGTLVAALADGKGPDEAAAKIRALDNQQRVGYIFQAVLLLVILILSIVKPEA